MLGGQQQLLGFTQGWVPWGWLMCGTAAGTKMICKYGLYVCLELRKEPGVCLLSWALLSNA